MEIKIKVPKWVKTDDEGICMLFAFLRKIVIEYQAHDTPLDMYGYDMRRIMDREENDLHLVLQEHVDPKLCQIGKLSREHFVFFMKESVKDLRVVTLKKTRSHIVWAYLTGCSNWNLLEESNSIFERPAYTPMYRFDKEMFEFSHRDYK